MYNYEACISTNSAFASPCIKFLEQDSHKLIWLKLFLNKPLMHQYPIEETTIVNKTILLLALFLSWGCTSSPVVTNTPTMTVTPAELTSTPSLATVPPGDMPYLPNSAWQPGAYNPDVTQATIQTTICVPGYSAKIRPPVSYTDKLKGQQIKQYGYSDTNKADYEEDHLIALGVGGHPTDPKNLWPEPRYSTPYNASVKDTLENTLHDLVCSGQVPLDTARQAMAADWVAAYRQYVGQTIIVVTGVPTEP